MTNVNSVSFRSLSMDDITRMPSNAVNYQSQPVAQDIPQDEFVQTKSSAAKNTLIGAGIVAATLGAIVGLKYAGRNSFMKFDANGTGFMNAVKKGLMTAADYIEKPFIYVYDKIKNIFTEKVAVAVAK